jgi:hypothetical protein
MVVLPALSLNQDAVAYAIASAVSIAILIYAARIPFKRYQHHIFLLFMGLVTFYFADHFLAEIQTSASAFLNVVWWAEVLTPAPLLLAVIYHFVLRVRGTKMKRWEQTVLAAAYLFAAANIALAATNISLFMGPVEGSAATGWTHGIGTLGAYLYLGGLEWPSLVTGALIVATLALYYQSRRTPLMRGQALYLILGVIIYLVALQSAGGLRTLLVSPLPPYLEAAGVAFMVVGMSKRGFYPITPASETLSRGMEPLKLGEGRSYLGMDQQSCFRTFSELVRSGRRGLCVTTDLPDEIRERYLLEKTPILWLANSERSDAVDPSDLGGLSASLASFIMQADKPAILLDGLDYLVSTNGFRPTFAVINKISQTNSMKGGIFLISSPADRAARGPPAILEVFDDVSLVQVRIKGAGAVELGENLYLQLDFFNIGKRPAYLESVENTIPRSCKVIQEPKGYKLRESSLLMGGKRIEPFQLETVIIGLQGTNPGEETIDARVVFRNDKGVESSRSIEPVSIKILQPQVLELESEQSKSTFSFLVRAFSEDYMIGKQPLDQSGWRSLGQVADGARISISVLYGSEGKYGRPIYELLSRGLIEERIFSKHRGRGGEAVKVRVSYEREPVKRYVDRILLRGK